MKVAFDSLTSTCECRDPELKRDFPWTGVLHSGSPLGQITGPQPPAGKQAVGISRRGHTLVAGCNDSLVITHLESGAPGPAQRRDRSLHLARCQRPGRFAGVVPTHRLPKAARALGFHRKVGVGRTWSARSRTESRQAASRPTRAPANWCAYTFASSNRGCSRTAVVHGHGHSPTAEPVAWGRRALSVIVAIAQCRRSGVGGDSAEANVPGSVRPARSSAKWGAGCSPEWGVVYSRPSLEMVSGARTGGR